MIEQFKKLMMKKAQEQASNPPDSKKIEAKASVMKELSDMLKGKAMGDMQGLKKVTVASDSPEGLEKGLELAKEKVEEMSPEECEDEECSNEACPVHGEMAEESSEESSEVESPDMEIAELEKKIAELKAKKA